jgi:hypothetical protein
MAVLWAAGWLHATARAGNRRFVRLSALRAHTKPPCKNDLLWRTLRALNRPRRARTSLGCEVEQCHRLVRGGREQRQSVLAEGERAALPGPGTAVFGDLSNSSHAASDV